MSEPLTHAERVDRALDTLNDLLSNPPKDPMEARRQWFNLGWEARALWEEGKKDAAGF